MSADAAAFVFRHSPYRGAAFQVHVAIGDSANDQFGYELWMRQAWLAAKARVSRKAAGEALARMVDDGLLVLLEEGKARGAPNRYRMVLDDSLPVIFDARGTTSGGPEGVTTGRTRVPRGDARGATSGGTGVSPAVAQNPRGTQGTQAGEPNAAPAQRPHQQTAHDVATFVWEHRQPRPAMPFIALAKVAESLLVAGWPAEQVQAAAMVAPTCSTRALEFALNQAHGPRQQPRRGAAAPVDTDRDGPSGRVAL